MGRFQQRISSYVIAASLLLLSPCVSHKSPPTKEWPDYASNNLFNGPRHRLEEHHRRSVKVRKYNLNMSDRKRELKKQSDDTSDKPSLSKDEKKQQLQDARDAADDSLMSKKDKKQSMVRISFESKLAEDKKNASAGRMINESVLTKREKKEMNEGSYVDVNKVTKQEKKEMNEGSYAGVNKVTKQEKKEMDKGSYAGVDKLTKQEKKEVKEGSHVGVDKLTKKEKKQIGADLPSLAAIGLSLTKKEKKNINNLLNDDESPRSFKKKDTDKKEKTEIDPDYDNDNDEICTCEDDDWWSDDYHHRSLQGLESSEIDESSKYATKSLVSDILQNITSFAAPEDHFKGDDKGSKSSKSGDEKQTKRIGGKSGKSSKHCKCRPAIPKPATIRPSK